jgi:hypothetical protein
MLVAELCGKIGANNPPNDRSEDVLTSQVLSLFRYLSDPSILLEILSRACNRDGAKWGNSNFTEMETHFWPRFSLRNDNREREADVLLLLCNDNDVRLNVVVETKYESGLSPIQATFSDEVVNAGLKRGSGLSGNQLADEYCGLKCGEWPNVKNMRKSAPGRVLYITTHYELPKDDFDEALKLLKKTRLDSKCRQCVEQARQDMYWLSWRDIHEESLKAKSIGHFSKYLSGEVRFMEDVRLVLERRGLKRFRLELDLKQVSDYVSFYQHTFWLGGYKHPNQYEPFWRG